MSKGRLTYGVIDFGLAALYAYLVFVLVPSRSPAFTWVAIGFIGVVLAGGVGMLVPRRWGRVVAFVAAVVMLVACATLLLLLLTSAAYLHGIYGGVGQAGAAIGLVAAALTIEVVGLVPALKLGYLWRTRGLGQ